MTTNSYKNRTTLWDDQIPSDPAAPKPIPARGAWRAPSAALSPDRAGRRSRQGLQESTSAAGDRDLDDPEDFVNNIPSARAGSNRPIPRRTASYASRTQRWSPRTNFGRIVLGIGAFIALSVLVAATILTRTFLSRDAHFTIGGISSIQSTGMSEVNRAELLPVFGEDIGRNIFFVPLSERRKQLEEIPWIKQAAVMRFLPDRLSVNVIERTPVAFVRQGQSVELVDDDGVILSMSPAIMAQHHYSFPVITGIDATDSPAARRARMAVYQRFVRELDQNQKHLTEQVSEIDLSDPEDLRATMPEQGSDILAHFGENQFLPRLDIYHAHIAEWRQRYPKLIGVDLRYNGEVPLEMSSENAAPPAAKIAAIGRVGAVHKSASAKTTKSATTLSKPKPATASQIQARNAEKLRAAKAKAAHDKALHQHAASDTKTSFTRDFPSITIPGL